MDDRKKHRLEKQEWLKRQVDQYADIEFARQEAYAKTLEKILRAASKLYAPLAIVQARAKSISSFTEKAIRKYEKYDDPVRQLTDLCGARIIVHTREQVDAICRFVRGEFQIDEPNCIDAATRLKEVEFGYLSVHLIVQVAKPRILDVDIDLKTIGGLKAEVQVRTVLQHAWADITHDRLYKSSFNVPLKLKRLAARTAALMEAGDAAFGQFESEMQDFLGGYVTAMTPKQLRDEIEVQQLILEHQKKDDDRADTAIKLAHLARASGNLDLAVNTLKDMADFQGPARPALLYELGTALVERYRENHQSEDLVRGQNYLSKAALFPAKADDELERSLRKETEKIRAAAAAKLAESYSWQPTHQHDVPDGYRLALARDPVDPYHLASLLEFRLKHGGSWDMLDAANPAMLAAIETCRAHAAAGLQHPRAWLTIGRLHLLLGQPYEALVSYARAICYYLRSQDVAWPQDDYDGEIDFLHAIHPARFPSDCQWIEQLLQIGRCLKDGKPSEVTGVTGRPALMRDFANKKVLIVAGGTLATEQALVDAYVPMIRNAVEGFEGIIISGGTKVGVPGLIGQIAGELKAAGKKTFILIGYHGKRLPDDGPKDDLRYDQLMVTDGDGFSAQEPLANWIDMLAAGIDPVNVRLLGINGGRISRFEYSLALALGATVGVVESSGRAASEICRDQDWLDNPKLLPLPRDPMTLHAFVHSPAMWCSEEQLETMGREVHQIYLSQLDERTYRNPSSLPWEFVPPDFMHSSENQALYIPHVLGRFHYTVVPATGAAGQIDPEDVEDMAEMEHGRWNVERLTTGWRFGPKKNVETKLNPSLVGWEQLPERIKEYDRNAVRNYAAILKAGGFAISEK